jgi:exosortase
LKVAAVSLILAWLYLPILARLFLQWWRDPNFSHGFFVPLFSAYVIWIKREHLRRLVPQPSWYGIPVVAVGLAVLVLGNLGAELFLSRFSLVIVLAGLVISSMGWAYQRELLFPWLFLVLMIPIPAIIFSHVTFPLQTLAANLAALILRGLGLPVQVEGHIIIIPVMSLDVAEACSGIRSLLSLITLSIIYGYLLEKSITVRVTLALAAVPIAVIANSLRIVGTGLVAQYWSTDKAEGFFHTVSGWLIFVVSLILLFLLHSIFRRSGGRNRANAGI